MRKRLRIAIITASFGFWLVVGAWVLYFMISHMLLGMGKAREVQVLAKVVSPDGFLEARVLRINGGEKVWQEVQIARKADPVRFLEARKDPGFVCTFQDEGEMPRARLHWRDASRLQIETGRAEVANLHGGNVLGIQIIIVNE